VEQPEATSPRPQPPRVRAANACDTVLPSVITKTGLDIHRYIWSALFGPSFFNPYPDPFCPKSPAQRPGVRMPSLVQWHLDDCPNDFSLPYCHTASFAECLMERNP
jgi:hypothetical protein